MSLVFYINLYLPKENAVQHTHTHTEVQYELESSKTGVRGNI